VIAEYIASGEPVGSRKLTRRYGMTVSSATVRNVLADLEDEGLVQQPHTSAGRVPTDRGLRLFVDALADGPGIAPEDRAAILHRLRELGPEDDIIRETGRLLSQMTGAAAVLLSPKPEEEMLQALHFMPLREGALLAVVITRSGAVQNRVVPILGQLEPGELDRVNNYLRERLVGCSLAALRERIAREMETERPRYDSLKATAQAVVAAAASVANPRDDVVIEGRELLFGRPEFSDVEKLRAYVRTFEEKQRLLGLLEDTLAAEGVRVLIGTEAKLDDVHDISVISSQYGSAQAAGTVGVIGPARMDYAKVVPLVGFAAEAMGRVLEGGGENLD
jgi:heat-inducible transcriptional repressor